MATFESAAQAAFNDRAVENNTTSISPVGIFEIFMASIPLTGAGKDRRFPTVHRQAVSLQT
jgi:hypothetical protein